MALFIGHTGLNLYNSNSIKTVTWTDGTDEEIVDLLERHYNGEINIHDY